MTHSQSTAEMRHRDFELRHLEPLLATATTVLELGGGTGWQASRLAASGHTVMSVDLPRRSRRAIHYPVVDYDGVVLPCRPRSFDLVFSSSVMEHVERLDDLQSELHLALKPGGLALHVVPSVVWRAWTSAARPIHVAREVLTGRANKATPAPRDGPTTALGSNSLLRRALLDGPHGVGRSATEELVAWRMSEWTRRLTRSGRWELVATGAIPQFYTGYALLPQLTVRHRTLLASVLGGSTCWLALRSIPD